jgi:ribosomal-protein-alanine N-acetyltransferase
MIGRPVAAGLAHAAALAELHAIAFPPAERWSAATFAALLALPGVFGLVVADQGLLLARVAADEAEILTLGVSPLARRAGCGAALLRAAEAQACADGARRIFLEVSIGNRAAHALYMSAGYSEVGRRARYYADGSDALILARPLSPAAATGG